MIGLGTSLLLRISAAALCGLSAWLSLGVLAVGDVDGRVTTVGLLPEAWVLAVCVAGAITIAWALPRLPAALLLLPALIVPAWLGVAWAPLVLWASPVVAVLWLALAAGVVRAVFEGGTETSRARAWMDRPAAVFLAALVSLGAFAWLATPPLTGDQPHYLVIADSLLRDGDLELSRDYDTERYRTFYDGSLEPRHTRLSPLGGEYSYHGIGTSLLVAPGFAFAGVAGARATIVLIAALGLVALWRAARDATNAPDAAWAAVAFLTVQAPFAMQAPAIYPDVPAAAITAFALWILVRLEREDAVSTPVLALLGATLAALPWLHMRLAIVAGAVALALAWFAWRRRLAPDRLLWFGVAPIVSLALWVGATLLTFDTPDPTAPFRQTDASRIGHAPTGLLAIAVDRQYGLLPYAPAAVLGLAGLAARGWPVTRTALGVAAAVTAITVASYGWWGGATSPARLLVPILPVLAFGAATWWARSGAAGRAAFGAATVIAATPLVLAGAVDSNLLINEPDGRFSVFTWMSDSVALDLALPSLLAAGHAVSQELLVALAWAFTGAAACYLVRGAAQTGRNPRTVAAWGAAAWIMLATTAAWWLRDTPAVTPGRSQLALLQATMAPGLAIGLVAGRPAVRDASVTALAVDLPAPDDPAVAFRAPLLPAGRYLLHAIGPAAAPARFTLRAGRSANAVASWSLAAGDPPPLLTLPVPVRGIDVTTDTAGAAARIAPQEVFARPAGGAVAEHVARYGSLLVYALDRLAVLEPRGFWLWRGRTTAFLVADETGAVPALELQIEAGDQPVTVRLTRAGWSADVRLDALATRSLRTPPDRGAPSTFIVEVSGDRAPGGAWIEVHPAPP